MVAASISIIFAAGTLFYFYKNTTSNFLVISSKNEVVTDTLPDGTIVTLNDHSLLKFALNDGSETRKVLMEGEVFFEVTPDSSRPFIVEAEHVTVKVLGTSFLVQDKHKIGKILKSDSTHVIVESGVVTVGHPKIKENIVLTAGERVDFETSKPKLKKRQNLEADHLFWKDRMIVFRKIKLHKVVKKLNELYNVEIELANEEIKNCKISASFKGNSLKEVLDVISLTFNLEVQKSADNKYIISGNACQ
ncbi:MAG: FecR domain-containing protein, partial [Flavobacteriales bacterium]|nr:FecR domain-containing protein [Flavobacteriales bacterium]